MLDIIDSINESVLANNHVLVSFEVVNMFPNIDDKSGLKIVKSVLLANNFYLDSTQCIVDVLKICLTCNNSKFNDQIFLYRLMVQRKDLTCCYCHGQISFFSQ